MSEPIEEKPKTAAEVHEETIAAPHVDHQVNFIADLRVLGTRVSQEASECRAIMNGSQFLRDGISRRRFDYGEVLANLKLAQRHLEDAFGRIQRAIGSARDKVR